MGNIGFSLCLCLALVLLFVALILASGVSVSDLSRTLLGGF